MTAQRDWGTEAHDLARGIAGGVLFGVPLLYTMEVWWLGATSSPPRVLAALVATMVPVALLIHTAGFRREEEVRLVDAAFDAVQAVALGVVVVSVLLLVLGELRPSTPGREAIGKVVYEAAPFAIGTAVARHVFARSRRDDESKTERSRRQGPVEATIADLGATGVGAVFVALNIAPTDEIPMLAAATTGPRLVGVVAISLAASYAIVFVAGFGDQRRRREQEGLFQHPITETVAAYIVALASAGAMLWFFQNLSAPSSWEASLREVVLLGLPASIGGAAGRLAV